MTQRTRFLYIMDRGDAFKVGMAASPADRVNQLRPRFGGRLDLVRVYDCEGWARWNEQEAHNLLADYALGEEFFSAALDTIHEAILSTGAKPCAVPPQSQKQVSIRFSDEELELLNRMAGRHKTIKAAVMAGLESLDRKNDLTQKEVLDWIRRNTR